MKKYIFIMLAIGLPLFIALPAGADRDDGGDDNGQYFNSFGEDGGNDDFQQPDDGGSGDDDQGYFDRERNRDYEYRNPDLRPRGYRRQPRGRSFGASHFGDDDRAYHYEGHWNSWDNWDEYKRSHGERYRHGRYLRKDGHLFYHFCDQADGSCFYFSIGR
ncbi:MAG: hypothetical protein P8X55_19415 [Desulfosarcinaceae bacterium]